MRLCMTASASPAERVPMIEVLILRSLLEAPQLLLRLNPFLVRSMATTILGAGPLEVRTFIGTL